MKKTRKIISIMILLIQLITMITNLNISNANIKEGDTVTLLGDHECHSLVEYWMASHNKWSYKIVWYVYYIDANTGNRYPAFCVEPAKEGVGTGYSSYNASITKETDNVIWRILSKGYMGSKWTDWNIENDDDFYSATKIALHSYKEGVAPKDKYILGNRSVDGNTVETIQRRGRKALDIAQTLYEYGINGKEVYESPSVNVNTNGEKKIENINGVEYYTQNYKVTANKTLNSYKVSIENFVSGTKILDSSNTEKSNFTNNTFKIAIPTKNIKENINGKINIIDAQVKTCPIYYAQSSVPSAQSYVTYTSSYELASTHTNLNISSNNANLKITKIDSKTKKPLPNVTFKLTDEKGANLGEYTTNQNGIIEVKNMKPGTVTIKEIKVDNKYVLNPTENKLTLEWGKTSNITIENDKKQGKINVLKTDLENNKITLEGVEFELYNDKNELIKKLVTDKNGEIKVDNLDIGNYTLKEVKTNEKYILNDEKIELKVEWNKETVLEVKNARKKGNLKIIKEDIENKEIKLEGVEFELYNSEGKCIEKLITNQNGEIQVENLDIGTYILKEVKTNEKYILNDEEIQIKIEWNKQNILEIQNARKKGNLKVIKQDIEDEQIKLEGVEFELYDNKGKLIDKYTTDVNGEIIVENLNIGNYYLKETKTNEKYVLNEKEIEIKIEWNKETKIEVKNLRKKGSLKIIKVDSENAELKLEGVEFELYDNEENYINKYTTNENGEIIVENLDIGDYALKEIKTNEKYILNEEKIETKVEHNKETTLEVKNDKIKGQIQITKISEDDNKITGQKKGSPIANVEFEIKDEQGNLVETIKTNEEGIAITSKLEKGKYSIKETKTDENYELNSKEYILEIKENNEIIDIQIANKSKNKLPRTGF
ncbi:MAG: Cys-Gln thioester bond-forming surface protein [Clostridia bacterium]|nr:Cys-Gln thioester bond-forming surface protein [Clostridia bacterium]